ncbi:Histone deacetylase phd1 [Elsinoe australis]|uniref:Histone deacetylase phd1 n=1 Tax=Elsinoe australis TaxID=40998 RepID=A0A2P7ZDW3_9PEZI|nr:Histone deacetylase phd1 [Elsinoe australis]
MLDVYKPVSPDTYAEIYPSNPSPKVKEVADLFIEWFNLLIDMRYIRAEHVAFAPHKHLRINTTQLAQFGLSKDVVDLWQMLPYKTNGHTEWNFGSDGGEFLFWGEFMDDLRGDRTDWWRNVCDPFYALEDISPYHAHLGDQPEDSKSRGWDHEDGPFMRPWYATLSNCGNHGSIMIYNAKTDHIWLIDQLGGTNDPAFDGAFYHHDATITNTHDLNKHPSRPAPVFLRDMISKFRTLTYIPGGLYSRESYGLPAGDDDDDYDPDDPMNASPSSTSSDNQDRYTNFISLYRKCGWPQAFNPLLFDRLRSTGGKAYSPWASSSRDDAPSAKKQAYKPLDDLYMLLVEASQRVQTRIHLVDAQWRLKWKVWLTSWPGGDRAAQDEWEARDMRGKVEMWSSELVPETERWGDEQGKLGAELEFWVQERAEVEGRTGRYATDAWGGVGSEEWDGYKTQRMEMAEEKIRTLDGLVRDNGPEERRLRKWKEGKDRARLVSEEAWEWCREERSQWEKGGPDAVSILGSGFMVEDLRSVLEADLELEDLEREITDQFSRKEERSWAGKRKWKNEGGRVVMADPPEVSRDEL